MRLKSLLLLFLLIPLFLFAQGNMLEDYQKKYFSEELGFELDTIINPLMYNTVVDWLSTKYHYGGKNKKGVDCSSFVSAVYDSAFHVSLSGSSGLMFKQDVVQVAKEELKEGDLLFFKIRRKRISHVGIYLGHNKFVHATRAVGVVVSDLSEPYYKKYFYSAGRHKSFVQKEIPNATSSNPNPEPCSD